LVVGCAVAISASRLASASGLINPHVGDVQGQPELANPYAVFFNPAALGGITGTQVVLDGAFVLAVIKFDRTAPLSPSMSNIPNDPNRAQYLATNTGTNTARVAGGIPFVGVGTDFGSKMFFGGLAVYAPFGGSEKFGSASRYAGNTMFPGAVDGPQRWQAVSAADTTLAATGTLGFKLPDQRLSFGVGVTVYSSSVSFDKAINPDGSDDVTAPNGTSLKEGRAYLDVSGIDMGLSAGVYWEPMADRRLRIGASYTSQPGLGQMRLSGTFEQKFGVTASDNTPVNLLQSYPDIVRAGVAYRVSDSIDLRLSGEFDRWSVFANECLVHPGAQCALNPDGSSQFPGQVISNIPTHFKNAFAVHAGLGYWPAPRTELYFDSGVDSSAIPDTSQGTTLFDSFKIMNTVGVRHRLARRLTMACSYTFVYYLPITVTDEVEAKPPSDVVNANGSYAAHLSFFDVNAHLSF
jgi:long-subunit fatty acid transport protein